MGLAMPTAAVVTSPEMIGVLAWWAVLLAAPVIVVRRHRRRRRISRQCESQEPEPPPSEAVAATTTERNATPVAGGRHSAAPDHERSAAGPPASLPSSTLAPLCRYVDFRRRLELAASELRARLSQLPRDRWRIEPYPLTGERRNTLLLLGETGVFVISATYAPGHWDDVVAASKLARKVQLLLPGYPRDVQPAVCYPFTPSRPRLWHRPDEHGDWVGAWLLGGDSLIDWLLHFGSERGLHAGDLARFDQLAKPDWLKPAIPCPPSWPPIPKAAPPGSTQ